MAIAYITISRFAVGQYEGLVVHGPLLATMMLDLVRQNFPDAAVKYFQFRALAPVFDTICEVCGRQTSPSSGNLDQA